MEQCGAHHGNEIDGQSPLAKFLLKTRIGVVRRSLGENLDSFFEIANVSLIAGLLEKLPCLCLRLVRDAMVVNQLGVLAINGVVTYMPWSNMWIDSDI